MPDTQKKQLLLILNPGARAGRTRNRWTAWQQALRDAGYSVDTRETTSLAHATTLAQNAPPNSIVVTCGGDGTISHTLHGLMHHPKESRPALGVLYTGTSPDFCRFHNIPTAPQEALDALLNKPPTAIDIGRIICHDVWGEETIVHFGCAANIGIGADVARRANRLRPFLGDALGTATALLPSLCTSFPTLRLQIESHVDTLTLPRCCTLTAAKSPFIASGLKSHAQVTRDDGRLGLLAIHNRNTAQLLSLLPSMYRGTTHAASDVLSTTCQSLDIRANQPCPVEADGDPRGWLPAHIEVVPKAIQLLGSNPTPRTTP